MLAFDAVPAAEIPMDARPPAAHAAFVRAPWRWPTRRIAYFNAARANAGAVRKAVRAWNGSGTRLRFVRTSRRRARVVIRYWPSQACVPGGVTSTSFDQRSGRAVRAVVRISRPDPLNAACTHWALTLVTAHELGHALGLDHETRRCALMNPTLANISPQLCRPSLPPWQWRCRILERDDVRGAVRVYGGRAKRRGRAVCDLFKAPATPGSLTAAPDGTGALAVGFARPITPRPPPHVLAGPGSFIAAARTGACPATPAEADTGFESAWTVPDGAVQTTRLLPAAPGQVCVAVWARDGVGRLSPAPATTVVSVP
ncbi:MAG: matrixin family metalloprotease [Thermoleophilaceae bacterium]|nr:matrixin family metalloprotease [Thermoleophilaceae bacterium]